MTILGIIPARYQSTRFPGKPLADIMGKSMVQRVYEQASQSASLTDVVVATDDDRILKHVQEFGGQVVMTSRDHQSGTDRCDEVVNLLQEEYDVVINIQGDEPFIHPEQIDLVADLFEDELVQIGSLYKKVENTEQLLSGNVVKVVVNVYDEAICFSRSPLPFFHNLPPQEWLGRHPYYHHVGIYGYRTAILDELAQLEPSLLEQAESLEQLRWLENGYTINLAQTHHDSHGIDTPEELERVVEALKEKA